MSTIPKKSQKNWVKSQWTMKRIDPMSTLPIKSTKLLKDKIADAIDQSESTDTIVYIEINEIDGDSGDVLTAIEAVTDCETDYKMVDREGIDLLDVWGFEEDDEDDMLWRLNITFLNESH